MRKSAILTAVLALAALVLLGLGPALAVGARDATPSTGAAPITVETLGSTPARSAPGMQLVLMRFTLAPGAVVPPHVHPGQVVFAVESGTLAFTVVGGPGQILRAGAGTPTASEAIAPGSEVILRPGDWFVEAPGVVHTGRNPGDKPTVLLASALVAADQPFLQPMEMGGTPTP